MSTRNDLSSLPPAVLRAALEASEKRIQREREKTKKEMRQLQKRLGELDQGADAPEQGPEKPVAGGSKGKKRQRADSDSSDDESDEAIDVDEWYDGQWPIAEVRKLGEGPRPSRSLTCSRCRGRGVPCKRGKSSGNRKVQTCLECRYSKKRCDLKRAIAASRDEESE